MNNVDITNIAIKIGELSAKTSFAIIVAIIGAIASIICAILAGCFKITLDKANQRYQQQWAFIGKKTLLFDAAIEICSRMLWNKLLLAANKLPSLAQDNLFLLDKDCLVVETQLLLYGNQNLADALRAFREKIINTPENKVREEWTNIIDEGRKQICELKKDLYGSLTERYETFASKLKPPDINEVSENAVNKIGSQLTQCIAKQ